MYSFSEKRTGKVDSVSWPRLLMWGQEAGVRPSSRWPRLSELYVPVIKRTVQMRGGTSTLLSTLKTNFQRCPRTWSFQSLPENTPKRLQGRSDTALSTGVHHKCVRDPTVRFYFLLWKLHPFHYLTCWRWPLSFWLLLFLLSLMTFIYLW